MDIKYEKKQDIIDELKKSIRSFNDDHSPYHKASRQEGYVKHILITEKEDKKLIGGLSARMYWQMIYLDEFFVRPSNRHAGIGSKMLKKLIEIAKEAQVDFICLETFSFQARDFYEKFGFYVIGEIKDYPPGESMYTMRLDLKHLET
ncbi:GNAT family N-acetyltransferase [Acidaminobacter sp. JC074]|uniref:GNAT family N-acetyltransferase n=1 Tax=Acidaminobacter sp. JC074 TaxID=2530199 RepID=UPI001F0EEF4E|nr:GNAT family N-acetyltransferase [Acidaminobacter sp. JC074]MCH4888025.1 GNAT family N-acetyltransferase [Acidaminobacter sp. JC074]